MTLNRHSGEIDKREEGDESGTLFVGNATSLQPKQHELLLSYDV